MSNLIEDQKTINDFGKMIRKWRLERNYGLRDFAILLGISAKDLARIENKNVNYQDFVNKIKKTL